MVGLFNVSFARGVFPASWKRAKLLALKKASILSSPSDFRPIAMLRFLSKVLEKLAHDQIVGFLEEGTLLDTLQAGFRKLHGTQLLKLTEDILIGIDRKVDTFLSCMISVRLLIPLHHPSCWLS